MSIARRRTEHADTAPEIRRGPYGQALWPDDTREAFYQLCDLARVAPDTTLDPEALHKRLWDHGEGTKRSTVDRIYSAKAAGAPNWRETQETA